MIVHISHAKSKDLMRLGAARNSAKESGWTRRRSTVFNDRQLDYLGCIGEWAASQVLEVAMDENISVAGDRGIDLVKDGETYAVKFNHRRHGYLMVEGRDGDTENNLVDLTADYLISVTGRCVVPGGCVCADQYSYALGFDVLVAGIIARDDFISAKRMADWGLGVRYYVRSNIPPLSLIS